MQFDGRIYVGDHKNMSIRKKMKGLPSDTLSATGLLYHDWTALTPCQRECNSRLIKTIQMEEEAYLHQHPEACSFSAVYVSTSTFSSSAYARREKGDVDVLKATLSLFVRTMVKSAKRKDILKAACNFYMRPVEELDEEIRKLMRIPPDQDKYTDGTSYACNDWALEMDLKNITVKHYPAPPWTIRSPCVSTPNTASSSFISVQSSDTTLPTPEPVIPPTPTISEIFYNTISLTVDKAIYSRVDEGTLLYDTAYVELSKCVEEAMEIPVIYIRQDIAELLFNAYYMFNLDIMGKERIAAEMAWDRRMRKKLKRSLRRMNNFRGYETPPTPKSVISSHESYKIPPQRPCVCQTPVHYNRYAKDRFGIYLPLETEFCAENVTATPVLSAEHVAAENKQEDSTDS